MDIAVSINQNYLMPSGVMLCSLFENNKEEQIVVHALLGRDGEKCKHPLEEIISKYDQKIIFYDMAHVQMDDFPVGLKFQESFITKEAYFRLFLMNVLPQDIDKVLYLDSDIIICRSIYELWNEDICNVAIGAVPDGFHQDIHETNRVGYEVGLGIFNSGVLLINLKYWREHNVMDDFLSYAKKNKNNLKYHDQDILNYVFRYRKKELPIRFNLQTIHMYHDRFRYLHFHFFEEIKDAFRNPVVIHFTGPDKPWYSNAYHPLKEYFEKYRKMTQWKSVPLRRRHISLRWKLNHLLICILRMDMHFYASYFDPYFRNYERVL